MGDNGPVQCGTGKAFGRGRKHMYEYDSRVRLTEVGQDRRMTLTAILNAFQDCSTFHSEEIWAWEWNIWRRGTGCGFCVPGR